MAKSRIKFFGFTLLELLVVIAIIGILAAIGIGSYGTVQSKARDARRKSDLENVARALEMYRNDVGSYPAAGSANGQFAFGGGSFVHSNGTTVYMQKTPEEKRGGYGYFYEVTNVGGGTNNGYYLYARLENQEDAAVAISGGGDPGVYQPETAGGTPWDYCGNGCNYVISSTNKSKDTLNIED